MKPISAEEGFAAKRSLFEEALESEGITPEKLAHKLAEELEANETKVFSGRKGVIYSEPLIAWDVRQRARQDAHKLLSHYPAKEVKLSGDVNVNRNFNETEQKIYEALLKEAESRLNKSKSRKKG